MPHIPLAARMRPKTIDQIIGQDEVTHKDSILWKMIEHDVLTSLILYGPPGTGKTSIAHVIAMHTKADFQKVNAVDGSKKDLTEVVKIAKKNLEDKDLRTILFIDEIHRFNKAQQDYLLPFVEDGTIILIGATTENPFFEVNNALVSRSHIITLKPIGPDGVLTALNRAMTDPDGLDMTGKTITDDALNLMAEQSNGDIDLIQKPNLLYDKDGDNHYDTISAFIKSMRGSDPDATIYYLAKMIESGEDPKFIARRLIVHASEDVGNADPMALMLATAAMYAVTTVGLPEASINLCQAATYIAMAPKSNQAASDIGAALQYVHTHPNNNIPVHLRDAHYKNAKKLGHGVDYLYPHDFKDHWVNQRYLPDDVQQQFYHNNHMGYEQTQADYQNDIRRKNYQVSEHPDNK